MRRHDKHQEAGLEVMKVMQGALGDELLVQ